MLRTDDDLSSKEYKIKKLPLKELLEDYIQYVKNAEKWYENTDDYGYKENVIKCGEVLQSLLEKVNKTDFSIGNHSGPVVLEALMIAKQVDKLQEQRVKNTLSKEPKAGAEGDMDRVIRGLHQGGIAKGDARPSPPYPEESMYHKFKTEIGQRRPREKPDLTFYSNSSYEDLFASNLHEIKRNLDKEIKNKLKGLADTEPSLFAKDWANYQRSLNAEIKDGIEEMVFNRLVSGRIAAYISEQQKKENEKAEVIVDNKRKNIQITDKAEKLLGINVSEKYRDTKVEKNFLGMMFNYKKSERDPQISNLQKYLQSAGNDLKEVKYGEHENPEKAIKDIFDKLTTQINGIKAELSEETRKLGKSKLEATITEIEKSLDDMKRGFALYNINIVEDNKDSKSRKKM